MSSKVEVSTVEVQELVELKELKAPMLELMKLVLLPAQASLQT